MPSAFAVAPVTGDTILTFDDSHWRVLPGLTALAFALTAGAAAAQEAPPAAPVAVQEQAAPAAPAAAFEIRAFAVRGNKVLSADAVERAIYPFTGPDKSAADVELARAALQKAFEDAGYVAVSVFIPEQGVESGILSLEVQQQAIGQVLVEGTKRQDAVRALAPSLTPGTTPNMPAFQRDVIALNQSPRRRVTPELRAGVAPGTLDVVLAVEESSAFHASAELNNFASAATTALRASATLRYDDMWGRGDSLSISAQTAPRRTRDGTVLSGNYLMRLGQGTQVMLYGVHSDSDIAVVGGTSVIGKGNIVGARFIQSLGSSDGFYHALTLGIDWKDFTEDVLLGADRASAPIEYFPVIASWRGDWTADKRRSDVTLSTVFGIRGLGDDWVAFDAKRYNARPSFFTVKLDAGHNRDIVAGLQIDARLTGQWSPDPLISNEGFSLGGMQSVRGYYESERLADYGVAAQFELRSPNLGTLVGKPLDEFRVLGFWDAGWGGIHDPLAGQDRKFRLMTVGAGARAKIFSYLNGAIDVGTPLISGPDSLSGDIFARFRIWGEF
ncbi:ShlB/FhaC/HecB family hemolysin secretion/activation protein [Sphingomonas sp. PB4P5]|uniref:ShlB/FhaC/HecB family hemolysin secretion/activation protein n=1 Tax=Parasphingomonas puruogangriensis TaxID=3096155 RepID=UPI002FCA2AC8